MAISEAYSGTETVTNDEWSLTGDDTSIDTITTDGIYQVWLDLSELVAGDIFEFKVYEKVTSGGTQRLCYTATFAGLQGEPHWVSPSFLLLHGWDMTLYKLGTTDRSITWSIRSVA
jgi:hypothetical protein